uniref:UL50 n=1 Tax=Human herpesvirus 1 TaxID=10298 RepID=G8H8H2_HHV1|nr:UL50 [Human alphaherpesvirus 1]AER37774.1 UL50 [Human alphaherpesvirus 1]AWO69075.1 UL50 [Human alphaherpesvirus 1]AWO70500.1 UL50 [Human alphaherpesvirus 1]AWW08889.1 UL50 [Human alphaherpesvirus 1]
MSQWGSGAILVQPDSLGRGYDGDWHTAVATRGGGVVQLNLVNRRAVAFMPKVSGDSGWAVGRVSLDLRMAMPADFCAIIHAPALASPGHHVILGLIDSGYRGTVMAVVVAPKRTREFAPGTLRVDVTFLDILATPPALTEPISLRQFPQLAPPPPTGAGIREDPWLEGALGAPSVTPALPARRRGRSLVYAGELTPVQTEHGDGVREAIAFLPKREEDAGFDIVVRRPVTVPANGTTVVQPSLRMLHADAGPAACYVLGRSSLNARGLLVVPTRWLPGHVCAFVVYNLTGVPVTLEAGAKVAQLLVAGADALPWIPPDNFHGTKALRNYPRGVPDSTAEPRNPPLLVFTNEFDAEAPPSERGTGGFGSTGI